MKIFNKLLVLIILVIFPKMALSQACGGGIYSLFVNSFEEVKVEDFQISFYEIKQEHLKKIKESRELRLGIPIDKTEFDTIIDGLSNRYNKKDNHLWKIEESNTYGLQINFQTFELAFRPVILKLLHGNQEYYLLGNFIGGCNRKSTFKIYKGLLSKIQDIKIIPSPKYPHLYYNYFESEDNLTKLLKLFIQKPKKDFKSSYRLSITEIPIETGRLDKVKFAKTIDENHFIYISTYNTRGTTLGRVFNFDKEDLSFNEIPIKSGKKIPDSLGIRKVIGLGLDDSDIFRSYMLLSSNKNGKSYLRVTDYDLKKNKKNKYELIPISSKLEEYH